MPEARATSWIVSSDFTMRVIVLWFVESAFVIGVLPFGAYGEPQTVACARQTSLLEAETRYPRATPMIRPGVTGHQRAMSASR